MQCIAEEVLGNDVLNLSPTIQHTDASCDKQYKVMRRPSTSYDTDSISVEGRWKNISDLNAYEILQEEKKLSFYNTSPLPPGAKKQLYNQKFTSQNRKTKIICAIGPSCRSVEMLCQLLENGMNVARLNFSHGTHEYHLESLNNLRKAVQMQRDKGLICNCAVLMDTKGPEIRTGYLKDHQPIKLSATQLLEISTDYTLLGDTFCISCSYEHLATSVKKGDMILVADGTISMQVTRTRPHKGSVQVRVLNNCVLEEKKNMSLPGITVNLPGITEKDVYDIKNFALKHNVDIVSGSFVRTAANVDALRECLGEEGKHIRVHAKIESTEGLRNIKSIIQAADGIHVSRGDLGMELSLAKLFRAQKMIIYLANMAGRPVVTSTQMLQSMTTNPRPTNAECTDVANAVIDGTDCVMLSGETASGEYPAESVATMSRIIQQAERVLDPVAIYLNTRAEVLEEGRVGIMEALASSAVEVAADLDSRLLVVVSETGKLALFVAKYRPSAHILVVTANQRTANQIGVSRGASSMVVKDSWATDPAAIWRVVEPIAKRNHWVMDGEIAVLVDCIEEERGENSLESIKERSNAGEAVGESIRTNLIKVITVGK